MRSKGRYSANVVNGDFVFLLIFVKVKKYKHNAELRGTAPGANIPTSMFLFMSKNMTFGPLGHVLTPLNGPPNSYF